MLSWMLVSGIVSAVTLGIAIHKRDAPKSRFFIMLTLTITAYCLGRAFESAAPNLESAYFGVILAYIGLPFIPVFMLLFVLDYYAIPIRRWPWMLLCTPLALSSIFVTVPQLRHLYYTDYSFSLGPLISQIIVSPTPYYYAMFGLHALLSLASLTLALWGAIKFNKTERWSSLVVFAAVLMPSLAEVLYVLKLTPYQLEITPLALALAISLLCVAVFQLNLLRVLPLAKDTILEQLSDAFILTDLDGRFLEANASAKRKFPALSDMHVGEYLDITALFPNAMAGLDNRMLVTINAGDDLRYYHLTQTMIKGNDRDVCICYTLHNVTDTRKLMAELETMANIDPLTGIYNRAAFFRLSGAELDRAREQRTQICAVAIDTDKFKDVNDTFGHFGGDVVLKGIASRISSRLRKSDIFGRMGGDEYSIVLPNTNIESAAALAQSLQSIIGTQPFSYENQQIISTISIGVAAFDPNKHHSLEDLLTDVDTALYQSKHAGRNAVTTLP